MTIQQAGSSQPLTLAGDNYKGANSAAKIFPAMETFETSFFEKLSQIIKASGFN